MKAIIFGANGQDGYYLKELLNMLNIVTYGVSRNNDMFIKGDIADYNFVESLIKENLPDYIFHLAANSNTGHEALFDNHQAIATGTLNILEAVYRFSKHSKVFLSGSGLQFVNSNKPIHETDTFEGRDPYSVSRIQSVYTARYYRLLGLQVYIGYFFNHDSPLRTEKHINQKIVKTVKQIYAGKQNKLVIGNITVRKEFTYAADAVNAVWILINNHEQIFEAVIGSGEAYSIEHWLELCFSYYQIDWKNYVITDSNYKADYEVLVSQPSTIYSLGWRPAVNIQQLAHLMLAYGE